VQVKTCVDKRGVRHPSHWVSGSIPVCHTLRSYHVLLYKQRLMLAPATKNRQTAFKPCFQYNLRCYAMEIFAFHPMLKKWMEVGNSGMFRPEMLRPMGLPEVWAGGCCSPRHRTHFEPPSLELTGILRPGKQYLPGPVIQRTVTPRILS